MHRQTPLTQGFVGYTSGGARALVDTISDNPMMQEMKGSFMFGEGRDKIESPQNYGFTSVVNPATKGQDGKIDECAEAFISFMGGNRSFPICTVMDDRRYRLKELKPGDVAMFDHLQHQMHFNNDGVFVTGRTDKKMKFQLAPPPQDQQQSSGGAKASAQAADGSSSGSSSSGSSSSNKKTGQKKRYDQNTQKYLEMTNDTHNLVHDQNINYKSGTHQFQPPSSGASQQAGGGMLVQIFGDKFTGGLGHFLKQVTAAPPTSPMHLATKGYIDSIFAALKISIPPLPPLPFPPLPPGITLPPGFTLPPLPLSSGALVAPTPQPLLGPIEARMLALEKRVAELESKIGKAT